MKQLVLVFLAVTGIAGALTISVSADDPTVDATVTPVFIGITASPSSLNYGPVRTGTTMNLPDPTHFTVTNVGTENVDLMIRGSNTVDWTLGAVPGPDQYVHRYGTSSGDPPVALLTTTNQPLWSDLVANPGGIPGSFDVFLSLDMPTTTSSFETQNASVTIVATES